MGVPGGRRFSVSVMPKVCTSDSVSQTMDRRFSVRREWATPTSPLNFRGMDLGSSMVTSSKARRFSRAGRLSVVRSSGIDDDVRSSGDCLVSFW